MKWPQTPVSQRTPEDPAAEGLRCDFCLAPQPVHVFEHKTFGLILFVNENQKEVVRFERGAWSACPVCRDLVHADQWPQLVNRVAEVIGTQYRELLALAYSELRDCIKSEWEID